MGLRTLLPMALGRLIYLISDLTVLPRPFSGKRTDGTNTRRAEHRGRTVLTLQMS